MSLTSTKSKADSPAESCKTNRSSKYSPYYRSREFSVCVCIFINVLFYRFIVLRFENANISDEIPIFRFILIHTFKATLCSLTWCWFMPLLMFFMKRFIFLYNTIRTERSFKISFIIHQFLTNILVCYKCIYCF